MGRKIKELEDFGPLREVVPFIRNELGNKEVDVCDLVLEMCRIFDKNPDQVDLLKVEKSLADYGFVLRYDYTVYSIFVSNKGVVKEGHFLYQL